jgi:phage pi2 protein 07
MESKANKKDALKDYVEVNVRVERFWEKYPNGRISTEIISWENGVVVMKASVYKDLNDPNPSATGFAYEKEGSTFINKTSALENCETSAVGRALAFLGFEIKKSIASKEEVENAILNQNNESKKPLLLAKWKTLQYPEEKFEEWYNGQIQKGYNEIQMEKYLTQKLMTLKENAS